MPYCKLQQQRTDQVILDVLKWLQGENIDFNKPESDNTPQEQPSSQSPTPRENHPRSDEQSTVKDLPQTNWEQQAEQLEALQPLFRDFAIQRKLGWDLSTGLLKKTAWKDILRVHKSLKHALYLKNIIALSR